MKDLIWRFCNSPRALAIALVGNIVVCGVAFSFIEHYGPVEGMYWGIVTGSTTGYGDFFPKTTPGRGIAAWLMCSIWFLSLLAAAQLTARMVADPNCFTDDEQIKMQAQQDEQMRMLKEIMTKLG